MFVNVDTTNTATSVSVTTTVTAADQTQANSVSVTTADSGSNYVLTVVSIYYIIVVFVLISLLLGLLNECSSRCAIQPDPIVRYQDNNERVSYCNFNFALRNLYFAENEV